MAEKLGITATLTLLADGAVKNAQRASESFKSLSASAKLVGAGMRDVKAGMTDVAMAGAGIGAAAGYAVKRFADFDGQMGAVKAVLGKEAAPQFVALTDLAQNLGATTAFTATEAAEAMENLARSGMKPKQIMESIGPVLNAAAAEGMDLGTAADIVASNLKAFQLDAGEAARVADTLAYVSAKTNTSMVGLQEGMKFVAPVAKNMGFNIEETAASLGVLADVGLKGSLAGTGLKNAMLKIAKGAENGRIKVGKMSMAVTNSDGSMKSLNEVMSGIATRLASIPSATERSSAAMDLLGMRGMGAAAAFDALGKDPKKIKELFDQMGKAAKGSSERMAKMRLDNLKGDFTLLSSAVDGVVTAIGGALAPTIRELIGKGGVGGLTGALGGAAKAFKFFSQNSKALWSDQPTKIKGVNDEIVGMVKGFLQGIKEIKDTMKSLFGVVKKVANAFGFMTGKGGSTQAMTKFITQLAGAAAVMAPLAAGGFAASKLLGGFGKMGMGGAKMGGGLLKMLNPFGGGGKGGKGGGAAGMLGGMAGVQKVYVVNMGAGGMLGGGNDPTAALPGLGKAATVMKWVKGVAVAGAAGYAIGTALDRWLGLSDGLSKAFWDLGETTRNLERAKRMETIADKRAFEESRKMAMQLATMSQGGRKTVGVGGKQVALTQEFAKERISLFLKRQGKTSEEIGQIIKAMQSTLNGLPTADKLNIQINLDGKKVGAVVGANKTEADERGSKGKGRRTPLVTGAAAVPAGA